MAVTQPDIAEQIVQQASTITVFGQTINVFAVILLTMFAALMYGIYKAQRDKDSPFDWVDMITGINQSTGKREASSTKIMQLVGGITATFVVVKLTLLGTLNWDMFAIYLAYVASVDGFTRFMLAKYGVQTTPVVPPPAPPAPDVVTTTTTTSLANTKPVDND